MALARRCRLISVLVFAAACGDDPPPPDDAGPMRDGALARDGGEGTDAASDGATDGAAQPDAGTGLPAPLPRWRATIGAYTSRRYGTPAIVHAEQAPDRSYRAIAALAMSDRGRGTAFLDISLDGELTANRTILGIEPAQVGRTSDGYVIVGQDDADGLAVLHTTLLGEETGRWVLPPMDGLYLEAYEVLPAGEVVLGGAYVPTGTSDVSPFIAVLETDASVRWAKVHLHAIASLHVTALAASTDGRLLVIGEARDCTSCFASAWLASVSLEDGSVSWSSRGAGSLFAAHTLGAAWLVTGNATSTGDAVVAQVASDGAVTSAWAIADTPVLTRIAPAWAGWMLSGPIAIEHLVVLLDATGAVDRTIMVEDALRDVYPVDDGGILAYRTGPLHDFGIAAWATTLHRTGLVGTWDATCQLATRPGPAATMLASDPFALGPFAVAPNDLDIPTATSAVASEVVDEYFRVDVCGGGSTTAWGTTAPRGACACSPASLCVGPDPGCALGLTCVGHYSSGGTPIAECSAQCGTDASCSSGRCTVLRVGTTFLGAWCL